MEHLDGAIIFWLIAIGMVVGGVVKLVMGSKGLSIPSNIGGGVIVSVLIGAGATLLDIPASLAYGFLGSLAILFLANVFYAVPKTSQH